MSKSKEKREEERQNVSVRLKAGTHETLSQISAQSGFSLSRLCEIGTERLIAEVIETGQVPVPAVKVKGREEVAA